MGNNKNNGRKRKIQFLMCLSENEAFMLEQKAYEFNISKTEFLRQLIMFGGIQKSKPRIDEEMIMNLIREINHIGNNINQIAYNTNVMYNTSLEDLKMAKEETMKVSRLLYECLKNIERNDEESMK